MRTTFPKLFVAMLPLLIHPLLMSAEPSAAPKHFDAYIGGFLGASYRVEACEGSVTYTRFAPGHRNAKRTTLKITAAQWQEFRKALDELKVWQWRPEYQNKGVMDGTQWSLDIAYSDRSLKSHGDNSYPDAAGKPSADARLTKPFSRYLAAVEKLLGGRTFR